MPDVRNGFLDICSFGYRVVDTESRGSEFESIT